MGKFILYLYKKPIKKNITILFFYYFFVVSSLGGIVQYLYTTYIEKSFSWGNSIRLVIFLLMCMLFRFEGILSVFRNEKNKNRGTWRDLKFVKFLFGPMGDRQFSEIGYIIMVTLVSMLSILIWINTNFREIEEIIVAILLPLIINVVFKSIYRRHFLTRQNK
jgi:hypothetical protein